MHNFEADVSPRTTDYHSSPDGQSGGFNVVTLMLSEEELRSTGSKRNSAVTGCGSDSEWLDFTSWTNGNNGISCEREQKHEAPQRAGEGHQAEHTTGEASSDRNAGTGRGEDPAPRDGRAKTSQLSDHDSKKRAWHNEMSAMERLYAESMEKKDVGTAIFALEYMEEIGDRHRLPFSQETVKRTLALKELFKYPLFDGEKAQAQQMIEDLVHPTEDRRIVARNGLRMFGPRACDVLQSAVNNHADANVVRECTRLLAQERFSIKNLNYRLSMYAVHGLEVLGRRDDLLQAEQINRDLMNNYKPSNMIEMHKLMDAADNYVTLTDKIGKTFKNPNSEFSLPTNILAGLGVSMYEHASKNAPYAVPQTPFGPQLAVRASDVVCRIMTKAAGQYEAEGNNARRDECLDLVRRLQASRFFQSNSK